MRGTNLLQLPNEILEKVFGGMDTLSAAYIAATCRGLREAAPPVSKDESFSLWDAGTHSLDSLDDFVDHVYDKVVGSERDKTGYHMTRQTDTLIFFNREACRKSYRYNVTVEERGLTRLKIYYDSRWRRYRVHKAGGEPVSVPTLMFVLGMRFMKKIYKPRPIEYNFDDGVVPSIAKKALGKKYRGELLSEIVAQNFVI